MKTIRILTIVAVIGIAAGGLTTGVWAQSGGSGAGNDPSDTNGTGGGTLVPNTGPGNATGTTRPGRMSRTDCESRWSSTRPSGAPTRGPQHDRYMANCMAGRP